MNQFVETSYERRRSDRGGGQSVAGKVSASLCGLLLGPFLVFVGPCQKFPIARVLGQRRRTTPAYVGVLLNDPPENQPRRVSPGEILCALR